MAFNPFKLILDFIFPKTELEFESENITVEDLGKKVNCKTIEELEFVTAFFSYKDRTIKNIIWSLKYRGNKKIAKLFAKVMYPYILDEISDKIMFSNFQNPILIPIPITKSRKFKRGFNQSEIIAEEIIKEDNEKNFEILKNILLKSRKTKHQARINKIQRKENIKNSFLIKNPKLIKGRNIILIDDVVTTGNTIREARKVLLNSGAKEVIAFVVAH